MDKTCSSLKESLIARFANELEVTAVDTGCILTLPLKTADDRFIDVWIERDHPGGSIFRVHDGGKNTAELFTQGVHHTDSQAALFKGVAASQGASFQDGRFYIFCGEDEVEAAVFSIAQCASLAMVDVISHEPTIEDEPLVGRVWRSLIAWKPDYVDLQRRVYVKGARGGEHTFDCVSIPRIKRARTVAVKVLAPSVGPQWQAQRYGFIMYDIQKQPAAKWAKLAVIAKAEEWGVKALDTVRSFSDDVILVSGEHEERIETLLPPKMTELTDAA